MSEAAAAAPGDRGFLSTLVDVFVAPGDAFRSIAARPRFLAPIALAVGLGLAFTAIWITKVDAVEFMRQSMEDSGVMERIPVEKRAEVLAGQARVFKAMAWIGPLVVAPLVCAALAGLFYVVFRFFYGADVTFRQSIAVVGWTFAAYSLLTTPLILLVMSLKGDWNIDPQSAIQASVAGLLDKATTPKGLYSLAGSLDLFTFWAMALLSIGYAAAMRTRATTAAWGIVIPWACWVLGKAALSALF